MKFNKTIEAAEERLIEFDHRVHGAFEPFAETRAVKAVDLFSKLGDQPEIRTIAGAIILTGIAGRSGRMLRAGLRMLIAHEVATFAKNRLKTELNRTRPRSADGKKQKKIKKGNNTEKEMTSFPSGHSAGGIAAARAISREYPEYAGAALGTAGAVALSQIPRCAHYPSDVAAGATIGLAAEALVNAVWNAAVGSRSEDE